MTTDDPLWEDVQRAIEAYCKASQRPVFHPDNPMVRLHEPTFGAEEVGAVARCMASTQVTMGPRVRAFEQACGAAFGSNQAVSVNSGSSANLLALAALCNGETEGGLRPGDEVIVSALSWSTTVWPLVQHGLVPVIVDIDLHSLNIDPEAVEQAIGPKTRAVMPVHVYGNPCDMATLLRICDAHDLILIEDCCEAMGARYDGRPVGQFGRVGTYSFYFSHHITTMEGGLCISSDQDLGERMRILRAHGWLRDVEDPSRYAADFPDVDPRFLFVNAGYNLRLTEPQGAMGLIQLGKLEGFVTARRQVASWLRTALAPLEDRLRFQRETIGGIHSWFGFPIILRDGAGPTVDDVRAYLQSRGVESRPMLCGNIARQPGMKLFPHRVSGPLDHADRVMARGFSIACHQDVSEAAVEYMAACLEQSLNGSESCT
ncbi:DegT/DnrJ/EryC1/StrS aminotransferase family protein [Magnetospira sp. QH-2]|uniref:DegT/DnrJ/EryC1/StrS family aminotransferase n=1 Tax=Magnetospira sp. (strain QH-2) TaxID=1288970 RepID=UPI0003E813A5|nr:DegT/DnrJ/EryC1/StrS family aminotransferase [Magnetospira sp. QH-2]CCQ73095.1 putative aminotransferase [DegT/DnrJ/EryC1/StrS domain] [Magnetospira sp. QH-2]